MTLKNTGRQTQKLARHLTSKLSEHFKLTVYRISKSTFMSNALRFTKGRCFFLEGSQGSPVRPPGSQQHAYEDEYGAMAE